MIERLPEIVRRMIAIGLLVVSAGLLWLIAIAPLLASYQATQEAIQETRDTYQRYSAVAKFANRLDDFAKQFDPDQLKAQVLAGDSDAISLAGLQSELQTIAVSNNTQVLSAQALPQLVDGEFRMVGVRIDFNGDLAAIQHTLHKIETGTPFLFITQANLKRREGAPENAAYEPIALDVQLDVYGARPLKQAVGTSQ